MEAAAKAMRAAEARRDVAAQQTAALATGVAALLRATAREQDCATGTGDALDMASNEMTGQGPEAPNDKIPLEEAVASQLSDLEQRLGNLLQVKRVSCSSLKADFLA